MAFGLAGVFEGYPKEGGTWFAICVRLGCGSCLRCFASWEGQRAGEHQNTDAEGPPNDIAYEFGESTTDTGYCGCRRCANDSSCADVIRQSLWGHTDPACWHPLSVSTLFSEGWNEPWVASPNGSGGAPRQGWINAADGNMYRLSFLTFAEGFNDAPQENAYLGGYTLLTPLNRRLMLITNVPFVVHNNVSDGLPTIDPQNGQATLDDTTFGDISFTPRVLLYESRDFSLTADLTVLTPTGDEPVAGKSADPVDRLLVQHLRRLGDPWRDR